MQLEEPNILEVRRLMRSRHERRRDLLTALGLLPIVLAVHVWCLADGYFFTDHWQRAVLSRPEWSFANLMQAGTLDLPGHLVHCWWRSEPVQLVEARPAAYLLLKVEYLLSGGRPALMHFFGLCWHALTAVMVFRLVRWLGCSRPLCLLAGVLVVIHPHTAFSVGWVSAQPAVMGGAFLVSAIWCYAWGSVVENTRRSRRSHRLYQIGWRQIHAGWLALALGCWAVALFCHESAVIFPLVVMLLDLGGGKRPLFVFRLPVHLALWSAALAYAYWRLVMVTPAWLAGTWGPVELNGTLLAGLAAKGIEVVFSTVLGIPLFLHPWITDDQSLVVMLFMLGCVVGVVALYAYAARDWRCQWVWPVWAGTAMLPTLPGFGLPTISYAAASAWAIMLTLMVARLQQRGRLVASTAMILAMLIPFAIYRGAWRGMIAGERLVLSDIESAVPAPPPGAKVFMVNLPAAGLFVGPALRQTWNMRQLASPPDLEIHALSLADHPLMMRQTCTLTQANEHELVLSIEGDGYFQDPLSRLLARARVPAGLQAGSVSEGEVFDTTVIEAGPGGPIRLRFTFHQPLITTGYYFLICSPERSAYWRSFDRRRPGNDDRDAELFVQARSEQPEVRKNARRQIARVARPIAVQRADPIQAEIEDAALDSSDVLAEVEHWWKLVDASSLIREQEDERQRSRPLLNARDFYFSLDHVLRRITWGDRLLPTGSRSVK